MEIRRINDIQYWADAGSLNYAGVECCCIEGSLILCNVSARIEKIGRRY